RRRSERSDRKMVKQAISIPGTSRQTKDKANAKKGGAQKVLLGGILPLALVIVWEALSRAGVFPAYQLPAPSVILSTITGMAQDGSLWGHVGITVYRVFAGFLIGALVAVILGSVVGFYKKAEHVLDPTIQ